MHRGRNRRWTVDIVGGLAPSEVWGKGRHRLIGVELEDVLIPFNFTKLALLMERGGCGPGQILQSRMEATVALATEGPRCFWDTPTMFTHSVSCGLRD